MNIRLASTLRLLYLHNKQSLMRLRYDAGRELVVLLSTATLLGLFYYIFSDFLQEKLREVPLALRQSLSTYLLLALLLVLGPIAAGWLRELWRGETSWKQFAARCGEHHSVLFAFALVQTLALLGSLYGLFWLVLVPRFHVPPDARLAWGQLASLILGGMRLLWLMPGDPAHARQLEPILSDRSQPRAYTLLIWRWHQLSRRNRLARLCLALGVGVELMALALYATAWPFFTLVLLTMLSSLLLACALAFQLEEDMRSIWFERQIGCSHAEFVAVYQWLCSGIGLALGLLAVVGAALYHQYAGLGLGETWKVLPIGALFPLLLPAVMFQLAPDRPLLQILVTALIGLFLGTAIYAHGLAVLAVPFVMTYAKNYQKDNFYRT